MPFTISDFEKKVISIIAKSEFKKNSLINLSDYIIDKNERKIKKNNLELKLSEKEINFLILFSEKKEPVSKKMVLKNVFGIFRILQVCSYLLQRFRQWNQQQACRLAILPREI